VVVAASASAMGAQDGWFQKRATAMVVHRIERQLEITDEQREQIRGILNQEKPKITSLAAQLREENIELSGQSTFDEFAIRRIVQQHDTTRTNALVEREKVRFEVLAVLTAKQRTTLMRMTQDTRGQIQDRFDHLAELF
jgi:Spy/CpxP family protein refolding chaperone